VAFDGGSLRNAIPREATVVLAIQASDAAKFHELFDLQVATLKEEYQSIEPAINIQAKEIDTAEKAMNDADFKRIINLIC
jgi:dipeptidase D